MEPICPREDETALNDKELVSMHSQLHSDTIVTGVLQPSNALTDNGDIALSAAVVTLTQI